MQNILIPPAHDDFLLGIKRHGVLTVGVQITKKGALPSGEGEESHGSGNADIDADHPHFNPRGVLAR